ncbi:TPA: hypothetical protein ACFOA0_000916 [Neisseria meningitidis]
MIEFVRAKKRLLWAFVLLLVWTCGYRYAADKAEAEQTALIATYRHSSSITNWPSNRQKTNMPI